MDCHSAPHGTSDLDITYPTLLDPASCDASPVNLLPGDGAWKDAEYPSGKDWASLVQSVKVCITYNLGKYRSRTGAASEPEPTCQSDATPVSSAASCESSATLLVKAWRGTVSLPNYPSGCSDRIEHKKHYGIWWNTAPGSWDAHKGFKGQVASVCYSHASAG